MGREFLHVFEEWANTYDDTVMGNDLEYREVFRNYESILQEVVNLVVGKVLEFGAGTGNLTEKLSAQGYDVIAVEPSKSMRAVAKDKQINATFVDGDFLTFPAIRQIDTIVSTYAFHHLTDEEKHLAIKQYGKLLSKGGRIVFADTMFENQDVYEKTIEEAVVAGYRRLATDIQTEYYSTIPYLTHIFEENGFFVTFKRCNQFVWIIEAIKL